MTSQEVLASSKLTHALIGEGTGPGLSLMRTQVRAIMKSLGRTGHKFFTKLDADKIRTRYEFAPGSSDDGQLAVLTYGDFQAMTDADIEAYQKEQKVFRRNCIPVQVQSGLDKIHDEIDANIKKSEEMKAFTSGAKSTEVKPRYDALPIEGIKYGTRRMTLGVGSHGLHNYRKGIGDREFLEDRTNHLFEHILNFMHRRTTTAPKSGRVETPRDHLDAIIANGMILACLWENWPGGEPE
jgi:hypothetical protein